jgi:hypothetical protein
MDGLSSSLAVLTAMITPAVLISASGTMILSTSTRLGRVVDKRLVPKELVEQHKTHYVHFRKKKD